MIRETKNLTSSSAFVEQPTARDVENSRPLHRRIAELPDDSGEKAFRSKLPDDSGETMPDKSNLRSLSARETEVSSETSSNENLTDSPEKREPIQNKKDGLERERAVEQELREKYPETDGYEILPETYLRDKDGKMAYDPVTGERRRIDFVVVKDDKAVDSVEVTSMTAPKDAQTGKENRIRDAGGNYVKDKEGNLIEIPESVRTRIERRA